MNHTHASDTNGAGGMPLPQKLDLEDVRRKLDAQTGQRYWRSLEELAETPAFTDFLHREFPREASVWEDGESRRGFLKLMGASLALAGLTACHRQPDEYILPYRNQPEHTVPGKPDWYATALTRAGYATGVLGEKHEGRPTHLHGNPKHAISGGKCDLLTQAEILNLYDPDRSRSILREGVFATWAQFADDMAAELAAEGRTRGQGFRILTETVTSPALADQLETFLTSYPEAKWYQWTPENRDEVFAGTKLAFGEALEPQYRFEQADVVLSIDADFLNSGPARLANTRGYTRRRRVEGTEVVDLNRMYVVETTPSITGANADHSAPIRPGQLLSFAKLVARKVGVRAPAPETDAFDVITPEWIEALVSDLKAAGSNAVVVAGEQCPAPVQALAHAMNEALGAIGTTVAYTAPACARPDAQTDDLRALAEEMKNGGVQTLLILGGNPAYNAPADAGFAAALAEVPKTAHLSSHFDETSALTTWHLPAVHDFETWGDARAIDGTVTMLQPMIMPLYGGHSAYEAMAALLGEAEANAYAIVQDYWKGAKGLAEDNEGFTRFWRTSLAEGVVAGTPFTPKDVTLQSGFLDDLPAAPPSDELELVFRFDPSVYDGRYANNGWLQETPKPLLQTTWDNAVIMSVATAERLNLTNDEMARVTVGEQEVRGGVVLQPGQPDGVITLHLGYGRASGGRVAEGPGFDANQVRTLDSQWYGSGTVTRTGLDYAIARTEDHHAIESRMEIDQRAEQRGLIRSMTAEGFKNHPDYIGHVRHAIPPSQTLYDAPEHEWDGYQWGMTVDLNKCTGCNACMVACQSENNVAIVGKREVMRGREMHWIRVDRYYTGSLENPDAGFQPVMCQHCEKAPCEVVCPVAATVHDNEGLNVMVYNRCVGTRYCSNNCPYKVRRFNFLHYSKIQYDPGAFAGAALAEYQVMSLEPMRNPDVTVRSRGVMEKCTYCVQRISWARIEAKVEDRKIRDGEVVTACQQACPADAIVFGDVSDENTRVYRERSDIRAYLLLGDLNTRPRTSYLARITNPHPTLAPDKDYGSHGHGHGHEEGHGEGGHGDSHDHDGHGHETDSHDDHGEAV